MSSSEPDWRTYFGHQEPYPDQAEGIETAIDVGRDGGFLALEGACGTGKTMLALTAGIEMVRSPDTAYERVLVLTSVKQQLRQFEADLRTINDSLPPAVRPVSGVTLVGKADVCPYAREGRGGIDERSVYDRCEGLRERTRSLVGEDGATSASALAADARSTQIDLADAEAGPDYLETAGEPTPYPPDTATYDDGGVGDDVEYCPFYAGYLADLPDEGDPAEAAPFDPTDRGHVDATELVRLAASHGSCPHSVMGALAPAVEVVVGNYYHAFDPLTAESFTGSLLDDSTFVICDEAHALEPRVRDLVSDGVAEATLRDAVGELTRVIQPLAFDDDGRRVEDAEAVRAELADADVGLEGLRRVRSFVEDLRGAIGERVVDHLDETNPGWRDDPDGLDDGEVALRDPTAPETDELTAWAERAGYGDAWELAAAGCAAVARVLNAVEDEDERRAATTVGRVLGAWGKRGHERFFREIVLSRTADQSEPPDSWRRAYTARLSLYDCLPGTAIADRLSKFGGGVLMSATLAPMTAFRRVAGLDRLAEQGRRVETRRYGLSFPAENRASFAVDAPKFTYDQRGPPGSGSPCRRAHVDAVAEIARSPGNVLVGMPSYAEADWMAGRLRERLDAPVLLDEASDDAATEALKTEFFAGEAKVLVTSLRGTLTEGVDYDGDRLAAAAVCGVPIVDTSSPRTQAVRTAYDRAFDADGFETALTVPAVRKARQAIGRVIRGPEEVGVRALIDARYARRSWNAVRGFLPAAVRSEFQPVSTDMLSYAVDQFWAARDE